MKLPRHPLFWLPLLVVLVLGSSCGRLTQTQQHEPRATIVYVVRHAEKDLTPGLADPPLAPAGQQRALALRERIFKQARPSAIFTTNTTRTRATVTPLAELLKVTPQVYDARQLPALAARIRREYRDRVVVVVGHSNTVLATVEALGAQRPIEVIQDDEYGYLFKVSVPLDSTRAATAETQSY